jgi:hypothetical protein
MHTKSTEQRHRSSGLHRLQARLAIKMTTIVATMVVVQLQTSTMKSCLKMLYPEV